MRFSFLTGSLPIVFTLLLLASPPAQSQLLAPSAPNRSYEFLHVTVTEATTDNQSKLLLSPAFNGRTEVQLEGLNAFLLAKRLELLRHNEEVVSQCLGELSAAG